MNRLFILLGVCFLTGCASTYDRAWDKAQAFPTEERPAFWKQQLAQGKVSQSDYDQYMQNWNRWDKERKEEAALIAKMTPYEQAQYKLQKRQVELQEAQLAQAEEDARIASLRHITSAGAAQARHNAQTMNDAANTQSVVNSINSLKLNSMKSLNAR